MNEINQRRLRKQVANLRLVIETDNRKIMLKKHYTLLEKYKYCHKLLCCNNNIANYQTKEIMIMLNQCNSLLVCHRLIS